MAQKIGEGPIGFVRDIEINLDVPKMITVMSVSEEHTEHIRALQLFSNLMDAVVIRAIELEDVQLLELMAKMKLITKREEDPDNV